MSEAAIARAGIGRKFQRPTVFEDQSVAENLILALKSKRGPFAALGFRLSDAGRGRGRFLFFLPIEVGLTSDRENVIDRDRLHANVIATCALPVIVGIDAGTAR